MSVTREHMALFLVRLAGLVGIDVPDAGDTGFSDTDELSGNVTGCDQPVAPVGYHPGHLGYHLWACRFGYPRSDGIVHRTFDERYDTVDRW